MRTVLGLVALAGCVLKGDGEVAADDREVGWFDAIEVFDGFVVEATVRPELAAPTLRVEGEANLQGRLFTEIHGEGVLSLAVDPNEMTEVTVPPRATIEAPALRGVFATDRAAVTLAGAGGELALEAAELATVAASGLVAATVEVTARGSSEVTLAGAGPRVRVDVAEGARVDASGFAADAAEVTVAGADAEVVVCTTGAAPAITGEAARVTVRCAG